MFNGKTLIYGFVAIVALTGHRAFGDVLDSDLGRPVTAIGSFDAAVPDAPGYEGNVNYKAVTGDIGFYIPLSYYKSGVFGVSEVGWGKTAGTRSDSGWGVGMQGAPALRMFLQFDAMNLSLADTATLTLSFVDLDLQDVNDPRGFFEAVQVFDAGGNAITPRIQSVGQTPGLSDPYDFSVSGNHQNQQVVIGNLLALMTSNQSTWIELAFWSDSNGFASNTPESLTAELAISRTQYAVPEPATLAVLGLGGLAVLRRIV